MENLFQYYHCCNTIDARNCGYVDTGRDGKCSRYHKDPDLCNRTPKITEEKANIILKKVKYLSPVLLHKPIPSFLDKHNIDIGDDQLIQWFCLWFFYYVGAQNNPEEQETDAYKECLRILDIFIR